LITRGSAWCGFTGQIARRVVDIGVAFPVLQVVLGVIGGYCCAVFGDAVAVGVAAPGGVLAPMVARVRRPDASYW
jgi:hypothetical protein